MARASTTPIVVELGSVKKKRIKDLACGKGKIQADVDRVMATVQENLGAEAEGKILVPVVMVYKKKRKRGRLFKGFGY